MLPVKVCGLTRAEDARLAWDLGAAALGFIFHPASPRYLSRAQALELRRSLPSEARCVGVFVNEHPERINALGAELGLSAIQLHGQEIPETCAAIELPVIKAIRSGDEEKLSDYPVAAFLLEATHPSLPGGTGRLADWELAARLARRVPLILAGGLKPGNLQAAFDAVRPRGLDLSSGVETAPGIKDPDLLRALFPTFIGERPCLF